MSAVAWHDPYNGNTERIARDAAAYRAKLCEESSRNAADATDSRAAVTVKVYPVEHRALHAALAAVGSPPKLPDWYDALASLWIRIEDAYPAADARRSTETPRTFFAYGFEHCSYCKRALRSGHFDDCPERPTDTPRS